MRTVVVAAVMGCALVGPMALLGEGQQAAAPAAKTDETVPPVQTTGKSVASMGGEEEIWAAAKRQGCAGVRSYLAQPGRAKKYCGEAYKYLSEQKCSGSEVTTSGECAL